LTTQTASDTLQIMCVFLKSEFQFSTQRWSNAVFHISTD